MNPIEVLKKIIAGLTALIATHRTNSEEIARLKAEHKAEIDALKTQLAEEEVEDAEINQLVGDLENLYLSAAAAKPPTEEQIEEVRAIDTPKVEPGEPAAGNEDEPPIEG